MVGTYNYSNVDKTSLQKVMIRLNFAVSNRNANMSLTIPPFFFLNKKDQLKTDYRNGDRPKIDNDK
jgi:hypothetical protein